MKLDFKIIQSITVGAVEMEQTEPGICFYKCTKKQLAVWSSLSDFLGKNARSSTGIRLDFQTNSSYVEVKTGIVGQFEVKVDGRITHRFCLEENDLRFRVELGEGKALHRVVITLPSHTEGILRSVEVEDGAVVERSSFDRKLLFVGDSITQGYASKYDLLSYAYQVSDLLNAESVIQGIGGACFVPDTVQEIGYDPDTVFVAYGTNDFDAAESLEEIGDNAREFLRRVRALYPVAEIYAITPIWRVAQENRACTFDDCRRVIREAIQEVGIHCVDGYDLVPHHEDFFMDGLHPNDLGFCLYTKNLLRAIAVY